MPQAQQQQVLQSLSPVEKHLFQMHRMQKQQMALQKQRQEQMAAAAAAGQGGGAVPMSGVVSASAAPSVSAPISDPGFAPMSLGGSGHQQQQQASQDLLGNMADQL